MVLAIVDRPPAVPVVVADAGALMPFAVLAILAVAAALIVIAVGLLAATIAVVLSEGGGSGGRDERDGQGRHKNLVHGSFPGCSLRGRPLAQPQTGTRRSPRGSVLEGTQTGAGATTLAPLSGVRRRLTAKDAEGDIHQRMRGQGRDGQNAG